MRVPKRAYHFRTPRRPDLAKHLALRLEGARFVAEAGAPATDEDLAVVARWHGLPAARELALIAGVPLGPCVVREAVKAGDLAEVKRLVEELEAEDRPIVHPKTMDAAVFSTQANRHAMVDYLKSKGFPAEFDLG